MVAKKTNKKEARKQLVAQQFGTDTVLNREALYNIVKKNALFKGTKDNKQLVTNALVALVGEGMLQRNGSKKNSTYCLSEDHRNDFLKSDRMKAIKEKLTSSPKKNAFGITQEPRKKVPKKTPSEKAKEAYDEYKAPHEAAKAAATQKGLLTGLSSLSVQMIMAQKEIEDKVLSHLPLPAAKAAAELISKYVYIAAQMMQPQ
jgi:hypothetical protein